MLNIMKFEDVMNKLNSMRNIKNVEGMARFGIKPENNLGISVTTIREFARKIGKDHDLAIKLWDTEIRDARMVAACIDDSKIVTKEQMEKWVKDFNSWDLCDHTCGHLFDKTPYAYEKAKEWTNRSAEFQKRAGFSLIAWLSVHDKKKDDSVFEQFFPLIIKQSTDDRNYVKKAVSWALRNIGKRSLNLNKKAIDVAKIIQKIGSKTAKWIASDTIRELTSKQIQQRLKK
jgi:3-methyladenine DNA glycosylase AlkD